MMRDASRKGACLLAQLTAWAGLIGPSWAQAARPDDGLTKGETAIPFVGCESDGQVGPLKAPLHPVTSPAIAKSAGQHLAYYEAEQGPGVLAPRGWHCFGLYGSNGATLYVAPEPISPTDLFSSTWKGFSGPAIQISAEDGDTSGRFAVAKIVARVFPAHQSFAQRVIDEGLEPASAYPYGPYIGDILKYRNEDVVEFRTPAQTEGLGTASRLQKDRNEIRGVVIFMSKEPSVVQLTLRLPSEMGDLADFIIRSAEREIGNVPVGESEPR